jgi:hypothetical protein
MKLKASAANKITALRMASYSVRTICAQLSSFALVLILAALPLAGVTPRQPSILTPLETELVPLGSSIQAPAAVPFELPALLASPRLLLGILTATPLGARLGSGKRFLISTVAGFANFGAVDSPTGRSPPSV